jgi:hypothetical protein
MLRDIYLFARAAAFAFIIVVIGNVVIVAQSEVTGEWSASYKEKSPEKLHISFERKTNGGKNRNGSSYDLDELQGLSREQTQNGRVSFRLVREAGTIECEGSFTDSKGSGTFRFIPNRGYADAMRARGFDFDKRTSDRVGSAEERLLTAAMLNVTTALADDLRSANFPNLDVEDLFKAAIFKIDGRFMSEMAATGFPDLSMEDLVKARIFKIDADFVRNIKDMGFGADNFDHLVKYSIFKVTPEYLNELRNEGLTNLDPEEVVKLRIFKVDAAFVRQARAENPNVSVQQIVNKKIGVWVK